MIELKEDERTALFIDGVALFSGARNLGFTVDYRALHRHFAAATRLVRAYYYSTLVDSEEHASVRRLGSWVANHGYVLRPRPVRDIGDSGAARRRGRQNLNVEIAIDLLKLAPRIDHAVLFSGEYDLVRAVEEAQSAGVRITVVSTAESKPPSAAPELRHQADAFAELQEFGRQFQMPPGEPDPTHADG